MSNTRLINPLRSLEKTASDLASHLYQMSQDDFTIMVNEVITKYESITNYSSVNYFISFVYERERLQEMKEVREKLTVNNRIETLFSILQHGGWEETSINTNFIRQLMMQLDKYDKKIQLTLNELKELGALLMEAIPLNLANEIREGEKKIEILNLVKENIGNEMETTLIESGIAIANLEEQYDLNESTLLEMEEDEDNFRVHSQLMAETTLELENLKNRIKALEMDAKRKKELYEKNLADVEKKQQECEQLIQMLRQTLLALTPRMDKSSLNTNNKIKDEADKYARESYVNFIHDKKIEEDRKKDIELTKSKRGVKSIMEKLEKPHIDFFAEIEQSKIIAERENEVASLCKKRDTKNDSIIKSMIASQIGKQKSPIEMAEVKPRTTNPEFKERISCFDTFFANRSPLENLYKSGYLRPAIENQEEVACQSVMYGKK